MSGHLVLCTSYQVIYASLFCNWSYLNLYLIELPHFQLLLVAKTVVAWMRSFSIVLCSSIEIILTQKLYLLVAGKWFQVCLRLTTLAPCTKDIANVLMFLFLHFRFIEFNTVPRGRSIFIVQLIFVFSPFWKKSFYNGYGMKDWNDILYENLLYCLVN